MFLFPDPIVSYERWGLGGAFSGSAIPMPLRNGQNSEKAIRVFYTDDMFQRNPKELQYTGISLNGVELSGLAERMPITKPEHMSNLIDW